MAGDHRVHVNWTPKLDALLGKMPDVSVARIVGFSVNAPRDRRLKLRIPSYRSTRGPKVMACHNCDKPMRRKPRDLVRSKHLFCSILCAAQAQKTRDSEVLRYGKGWKALRAKIRKRDKVCRCCGKTPKVNGSALHVHHLIPFRVGGKNRPTNLVALCERCHHKIEALTSKALNLIQVGVALEGSWLTVRLGRTALVQECVLGVDNLTRTG
jgi:5-methylcytosine-specific restriction endonuclease McrA